MARARVQGASEEVQLETKRTGRGPRQGSNHNEGKERKEGASPGRSRREAEWEKLVIGGRGLISRGPAEPAAPDRELGKGQPPREQRVAGPHRRAPRGPGQINEGSRVDEDSAEPGGLTFWPQMV